MKKVLLSVLCATSLIGMNTVMADESAILPLNVVGYQLHTEQWATTQTAKVTIQFDGALTAKGTENIQQTIYQQLQLLSKAGKWYVTDVEQTKDSSDLQRIMIQAEARLPASELPNVQDKVKTISQPGATFTVVAIDFSPSSDEIQQVRTSLRTLMYQQAKDELAQLSKLYPNQHFQLHKIDFTDNVSPPVAANGSPMVMMAKMGDGASNQTSALTTNRKVQMDARVEYASKVN